MNFIAFPLSTTRHHKYSRPDRVGRGVTSAVLPHHRTNGSVYGGSRSPLETEPSIPQRQEFTAIKVGFVAGRTQKKGRAIKALPEKARVREKLENNSQAELDHASGQRDVGVIGKGAAFDAGVFQRSGRQIAGGVDAIARIWVIQDVER